MARKLLVGEVSLQDILDRLAFTEEQTSHAALEQAKLFMAAASYRIKKMRKRQETEMAVDNLRVDLSIGARIKYKGKKGVTEKFISEKVSSNPAVRRAEEEAATAKRQEEWAKHLLEAYEHRRTSLKILTQFAFMDDTFSGKYEVNRMMEKREKLKKALRNDRDEDE
jgi:hypothetical protein